MTEAKHPDDIFDKLTKNAIHFMGHSVDLLEGKKTDFALVSFYTGLELLVKARLCAEHWSLIVKSVEKTNKKQFVEGESKTVGLDESQQRLARVADDGLPSDIYECIDRVRKHRNRIVHFDHPARFKEEFRSVIAAEMCRAWYLLLRHIKTRWRRYFKKYIEDLDDLDRQIGRIREYLKAKYEEVKGYVAEMVGCGAEVKECPSCGYEAMLSEEDEEVVHFDCQVCGNHEARLLLPCPDPDCVGTVVVDVEPPGECEKCNREMTVANLIEHFDPVGDPRNGWAESRAYCGRCECFAEGCGTVVPIRTEHWMCMNCLALFQNLEVEACHHCAELNAPLTDGSGFFGCIRCDGPGERF